jgi:hypothetical protein
LFPQTRNGRFSAQKTYTSARDTSMTRYLWRKRINA